MFPRSLNDAIPFRNHGLIFGVYEITTEIAAEILKDNLCNRLLKETAIAKYARDMESGSWWLNGEALVFSSSGRIINGQHRCHAVIRSGVPVDMCVVYGVSHECFNSMDTGVKRSFADVLASKGEAECKALAAAASLKYKQVAGTLGDNSGRMAMSNSDGFEILARHPGLRDAVRCSRVFATRGSSAITRTMAAWMIHELRNYEDREAVDNFFFGMRTGENLSKGNPILAFRKRTAAHVAGASRLSPVLVLALAVKAWNAYSAGKTVTLLWYDRYGKGEEFPELITSIGK